MKKLKFCIKFVLVLLLNHPSKYKREMKKLIPILLFALIVSCKKEATQPSTTGQTNDPNSFRAGTIEVWVNSNYKFPYTWLTKSTLIPTSNPGVYQNVTTKLNSYNVNPYYFKDSCQIYFKNNCTSGSYQMYSLSQDISKYKSDSLKLWNRVKININGITVFEHIDSLKNSAASNSYSFTLY